jgi:hypothetical protein
MRIGAAIEALADALLGETASIDCHGSSLLELCTSGVALLPCTCQPDMPPSFNCPDALRVLGGCDPQISRRAIASRNAIFPGMSRGRSTLLTNALTA